MSHDETTTHTILCGGPQVSTYRTVYAIYGLRVHDGTDRVRIEEELGQCTNDGQPGVFWAGAYDHPMTFLAVSWSSVQPGAYVFHSGEKPNEHRFTRDRWNSDLRAAADRLGLEVTGEPGWYTIPSES